MGIRYITGASAGVGRALAMIFLERGDKVVGISRTCTIEHESYTHLTLDLANSADVLAFEFPESSDDVTLVNNAGMLGTTRHIGSYESGQLGMVMQLNVVALGELMNKFISAYKGQNLQVINISSGAGSFPIDGWGAYCASKAAVEMISSVAAKELEIEGVANARVVAVSPGIIDTGMQEQIRSASEGHFSDIQRFIDYKKEGELATPEEAASKILLIFEKLPDLEGVSLSVRDF